jgi:hypothetical protein
VNRRAIAYAANVMRLVRLDVRPDVLATLSRAP